MAALGPAVVNCIANEQETIRGAGGQCARHIDLCWDRSYLLQRDPTPHRVIKCRYKWFRPLQLRFIAVRPLWPPCFSFLRLLLLPTPKKLQVTLVTLRLPLGFVHASASALPRIAKPSLRQVEVSDGTTDAKVATKRTKPTAGRATESEQPSRLEGADTVVHGP